MATYLQLFNYFSLPFLAHLAENPEISIPQSTEPTQP